MPPTVMPLVSCPCTKAYTMSTGTMTIKSPAYILPRSFEVLASRMMRSSPTGSVEFAVDKNVIASIYSFQYDRKLKENIYNFPQKKAKTGLQKISFRRAEAEYGFIFPGQFFSYSEMKTPFFLIPIRLFHVKHCLKRMFHVKQYFSG